MLTTIDDFSNLFNNQITFKWNSKPEAGNYNLIAEVELDDGGVRESDRVVVVVE